MKADLLCMGCMSRKGKIAVCPLCGYADRGPENSLQLPPRTPLGGKYVIGRALGQGGFGITYLACDLERGNKLAIKEYFPLQISTRAPDHLAVGPISANQRHDLNYGLARFAEEGQALAQFKDRPGVVSMLDFLYANGTAYIVMAYVEGHDLKEYLHQRGGRISFEAALKILLPVMEALEELHEAGIIHRDISPDNIYVEAKGGVKILDFGATRFAMGEQSRSLSVVLKPGYAPEEQYRGKGKQGAWTDIYALGATYYRAITGQVPPEALDRLVEDDLVSPSYLGIAIPSTAEAALMKSLAVKAENRFQTVTAFREALIPEHANPPTVSPPALGLRRIPDTAVPVLVLQEPQAQRPEIGPSEAAFSSPRLPKAFLLCAISILLLILLIATISLGTVWGPQFLALLVLCGLMLLVFARMWASIQDRHARTTPVNVVAYCFIPFFNFYWAFPAVWGFAKDYNRFIDRHSLGLRRLNESVFLISSITYVAAWVGIPFGGFLASGLILLNACFLLPVVAMICGAVNALAAHRLKENRRPDEVFRLYCVSGDHQGQNLTVNSEGLIIGRSRLQANVVLSSEEVSARHARVWQDSANAGVWIEDMNSTNGTFIRQMNSADYGADDWLRLAGSKLLFIGDRFRLSEDGAEFEVKAA